MAEASFCVRVDKLSRDTDPDDIDAEFDSHGATGVSISYSADDEKSSCSASATLTFDTEDDARKVVSVYMNKLDITYLGCMTSSSSGENIGTNQAAVCADTLACGAPTKGTTLSGSALDTVSVDDDPLLQVSQDFLDGLESAETHNDMSTSVLTLTPVDGPGAVPCATTNPLVDVSQDLLDDLEPGSGNIIPLSTNGLLNAEVDETSSEPMKGQWTSSMEGMLPAAPNQVACPQITTAPAVDPFVEMSQDLLDDLGQDSAEVTETSDEIEEAAPAYDASKPTSTAVGNADIPDVVRRKLETHTIGNFAIEASFVDSQHVVPDEGSTVQEGSKDNDRGAADETDGNDDFQSQVCDAFSSLGLFDAPADATHLLSDVGPKLSGQADSVLAPHRNDAPAPPRVNPGKRAPSTEPDAPTTQSDDPPSVLKQSDHNESGPRPAKEPDVMWSPAEVTSCDKASGQIRDISGLKVLPVQDVDEEEMTGNNLTAQEGVAASQSIMTPSKYEDRRGSDSRESDPAQEDGPQAPDNDSTPSHAVESTHPLDVPATSPGIVDQLLPNIESLQRPRESSSATEEPPEISTEVPTDRDLVASNIPSTHQLPARVLGGYQPSLDIHQLFLDDLMGDVDTDVIGSMFSPFGMTGVTRTEMATGSRVVLSFSCKEDAMSALNVCGRDMGFRYVYGSGAGDHAHVERSVSGLSTPGDSYEETPQDVRVNEPSAETREPTMNEDMGHEAETRRTPGLVEYSDMPSLEYISLTQEEMERPVEVVSNRGTPQVMGPRHVYQIVVKSIPMISSQEAFEDIFSPFGDVQIQIQFDENYKCFAVISFLEEESARRAYMEHRDTYSDITYTGEERWYGSFRSGEDLGSGSRADGTEAESCKPRSRGSPISSQTYYRSSRANEEDEERNDAQPVIPPSHERRTSSDGNRGSDAQSEVAARRSEGQKFTPVLRNLMDMDEKELSRLVALQTSCASSVSVAREVPCRGQSSQEQVKCTGEATTQSDPSHSTADDTNGPKPTPPNRAVASSMSTTNVHSGIPNPSNNAECTGKKTEATTRPTDDAGTTVKSRIPSAAVDEDYEAIRGNSDTESDGEMTYPLIVRHLPEGTDKEFLIETFCRYGVTDVRMENVVPRQGSRRETCAVVSFLTEDDVLAAYHALKDTWRLQLPRTELGYAEPDETPAGATGLPPECRTIPREQITDTSGTPNVRRDADKDPDDSGEPDEYVLIARQLPHDANSESLMGMFDKWRVNVKIKRGAGRRSVGRRRETYAVVGFRTLGDAVAAYDGLQESLTLEFPTAGRDDTGMSSEDGDSGDDLRLLSLLDEAVSTGGQDRTELAALSDLGYELYVGNLPDDTTEDELMELFKDYQPRRAKVKLPDLGDFSPVFGFVVVPSKQLALDAIGDLHESTFRREKLKVNLSKRSQSLIEKAAGCTGRPYQLFVGNLPVSTRLPDLYKIFEGYPVSSIEIHPNDSGSKSYAFVRIGDNQGARRAIRNLNGTDFKGNRIIVDFSKNTSRVFPIRVEGGDSQSDHLAVLARLLGRPDRDSGSDPQVVRPKTSTSTCSTRIRFKDLYSPDSDEEADQVRQRESIPRSPSPQPYDGKKVTEIAGSAADSVVAEECTIVENHRAEGVVKSSQATAESGEPPAVAIAKSPPALKQPETEVNISSSPLAQANKKPVSNPLDEKTLTCNFLCRMVQKYVPNIRPISFKELSATRQITLVVTDVMGDGFFWGWPCGFEDTQFQQELAEMLKADEGFQRYTSDGQKRCVALYSELWYRGLVMSEREGEAQIFFVDYGNVETCRLTDMRSSPDELWRGRPIAVPFKAHGEEVGGILMAQLNRSVDVRLLNEEGSVIHVELLRTSTE